MLNKPAAIRAVLVAAFPYLVRDPDKLTLWVDQGKIAARFGEAHSFEYRYRLNVLLTDFTGNEDLAAIALLDWIRVHQPDLLLNFDSNDQALPFEVSILDDKTVDILFELQLTEAVRALPREGGGYDLVHLAEPPLENVLDGAPGQPLLKQIYLDGELALEADD